MKSKIMASMLLALICFFFMDGPALAYEPGFRTMGTWEEDPPLRMDLNIWYPARRKPRELEFPPWLLTASLNARPAEGQFPLLLLSHDTPTDRFAYHSLAALLASQGFFVVAPNHGADCMNNMDDLFTWQQLDRRATELTKAIDLALADKELANSINPNAIGIIGFGSGATTALLLGGALPSCAHWGSYCPMAGKNDVYCSPWAIDRLITMCGSFPLAKSLADTRIKAVAAIAPGYGMLFDAASFRYFYPALLLVAAGNSLFNRSDLHCEPIARFLGHRARFLNLPQADTGALMAACPPALSAELPELCNSVTPETRRQIHEILGDTLLTFFRHYLEREGNMPIIKAPPDLSPELPGAQELPPPPATGKKGQTTR